MVCAENTTVGVETMAQASGIAATTLFAWALWAGQPAMGQDPVDGVCDESVR